MNRTLWYVLIGSLILLLSGIGGYFLLRKDNNLPVVPPQASGPEISPEDKQFALDIAKKGQEQEENRKKNLSYTSVLIQAVKQGNPELCSTIETEEIKIECSDKVLYNQAISKNDLKYCEGLSTKYQTKCRDNIIFTTAMNDLSQRKTEIFCDTITDDALRNNCLSKSEETQLAAIKQENNKLTQADCDRLTTSEVKDRCNAQVANENSYFHFSQAIETGDVKACDKIGEITLKEKCNDSIYYNLGRKNGDVLLCEKIKDKSMISQCQKDITLIAENEKFTKAINENSPALCETIQESSLKRSCLDRVRIEGIIESKDTTKCDILYDSSLRASCIKSIELSSQF